MSLYTLALFVHVVGVIGAFIGVSVWLFAAVAVRRAHQVGQVRTLMSLIQPSGSVAVAGILLLGAAGIYMAWTAWGLQASWIVVATVSFLLLAPVGIFVIDPRLRTLAKAATAAPDGPLPASLAAQARDPLVGIGLSVYIAVLLGIVFLMTNKPTVGVAILAVVVASVLGLASGLSLWLVSETR